MEKPAEAISFESLAIGYPQLRHRKSLLPPLTASAFHNQMVAVIGRNGTGKSTLLRTIAGIQVSLEGNIRVNGVNIRELTRMELARKIGFISTENISASSMTVYNLVSLGRFPHTDWTGRMGRTDRIAVAAALERTAMSAFAGRFLSELSDGEKQRAMIARVLAQDAGIMVMDEPTAFLDLPGKYEIMTLLRDLSHTGKCIIFSTHDLDIALKMTDRIWLLLKNRLVEGTSAELASNGSLASMFDQPGSEMAGSDYLKNFL
jgi:iron complex transport system ATP-binding protein